jgi:predicted adenylyl cyclase CyaB
MVAGLPPEWEMRARIRSGVRFRDDVFGGVCYVPQRDDFFAADKKVFAFLQTLSSNWREISESEARAISALASLGICETVEPTVAEVAYCGPSFLGEFVELPTVSLPLVVNCFCTAHCPLLCIYCHADDLMKQFRASESEDDLENVAATANMLPAMVAVITGGDPLTRPDRAVRLIERLAHEKALVLDTSGVGDIEPLIPVLKRHQVHVRVSLDAISQQNQKLRPPNRQYVSERAASANGATRTIDRCLKEGIPVTIQTVVTSRNENPDEWLDLRDWLLARGVRNWVLHVVVKGGSARRIEEAARGKRSGGISPSEEVYIKLWRLVEGTMNAGLPIDIRCTDTDTTPNSVLLVGSKGDVYTEGYAHKGKVCLYNVGDARPDLIQALWPHLDRFGHARRYLNWNPWFFDGKSLETICYKVLLPAKPAEQAAANPVETEAKFPVKNLERLRVTLAKLGYRATEKQKLQRDEYFDTPEMFSKRLDYVIRLRKDSNSLAVALKGPRHWIGKTYSRIELEFPAGAEDKVREALSQSGFDVTWYFEKRRTTFEHPGVYISIALDEIPELGHFIEIEGPLVKVLEMQKKLKTCLGPQERRNYAELFRAHRLERGDRSEEITGASFT